MKPITTSTYTFRDIRGGGFVYVDKTAHMHRLASQGKGAYFLSRPRRFGKSLTLSTLEEIFKGNRTLFDDLAIASLPYDWKPYPVIRLDLNTAQAGSPELLKESLSRMLTSAGLDLGIDVPRATEPSFMFEDLTRLAAKTGSQVVVLIDEYDKPILNNADNPELLPEILRILKGFYSVVKAQDANIRFTFITGVSKFSKVSIFSDLNNLTDLTMDPRFPDLCGFTQDELEANFAEHVEELARREKWSRADTLARIRAWYNGYRFSTADVSVYNPVSVGKLFSTFEFANYWFETGTPTMLVNRMRNERFDMEKLRASTVAAETFSVYEVEKIKALPLCFQTGYLTIAEARKLPSGYVYRLDYPNQEVEYSMTRILLAEAAERPFAETDAALHAMVFALQRGDLNVLFMNMRSLFAQVPYQLHIDDERYYHSLFLMIFRLLGMNIAAEVQTASGRVDAVVKNADTIYVLEFKLNSTADAALAQIRERRYHEPHLTDGRRVLLVGVEFRYASGNRGIGEWKTQVVNPPA